MPGDEKSAGLAGIYAEALLRVAEEKGCADEVLDELEEIVAFGDREPAFRRAFLSLLASPAQRGAAIERILRGHAQDVLVDFYQVLNRKGRPDLLPEVALAYRSALQAARGIVDVTVTSAVALSTADRERVRETVKRRSGLTARLIERVDPELLGGLVVRVRDSKFDTTLKTKLERLHTALLERASNEIIQSRSQPPEVKR
ncbi:MAG: synthase delta subunit [Acidobacteria bacterium]|jgi:F-type H+-transporting ATPase subunit delta|nr:synthase delta subunit [Acidobacteriota bacterium]